MPALLLLPVCWQYWHYLAMEVLFHLCLHLHMAPSGSFPVCVFLQISLFYMDASHIGLRVTLIQSDIICIKLVISTMTLFPNKVTF